MKALPTSILAKTSGPISRWGFWLRLCLLTQALNLPLGALPSSSLNEVAEVESAKSTQASVSMGLGMQTIASEPTSGTVAGAEIEGRWSRQFSASLHADVALDLFLETGAVRARYAEEFSPRQFGRIRQARMTYEPFHWIRLSGGAIDQSHWQSRLLFQRQSFPASTQVVQFGAGPVQWFFTMEQAIASDTSTRQPWGNWPTGLPAFFMEQIEGRWNYRPEAYLSLSLGHFVFQNVRGPSAFQAQFLGNSVTGTAAADARFRYAYQGLRAGLTSESPRLGKISAGFTTEGIWNHEAPTSRNFGWRMRLSPRLHLGDSVFSLHTELFEVEPDATLALYQPREFGHTNRRGFLIGVEAKFLNPSLALAAEWIESRPLINQPWQSAMTWVQMSLKTDYELL